MTTIDNKTLLEIANKIYIEPFLEDFYKKIAHKALCEKLSHEGTLLTNLISEEMFKQSPAFLKFEKIVNADIKITNHNGFLTVHATWEL